MTDRELVTLRDVQKGREARKEFGGGGNTVAEATAATRAREAIVVETAYEGRNLEGSRVNGH